MAFTEMTGTYFEETAAAVDLRGRFECTRCVRRVRAVHRLQSRGGRENTYG
jgi:hypothetical protein